MSILFSVRVTYSPKQIFEQNVKQSVCLWSSCPLIQSEIAGPSLTFVSFEFPENASVMSETFWILER